MSGWDVGSIFVFLLVFWGIGAMVWSGVVNHIERTRDHQLAMKKLELKQQELIHKQWLEEVKGVRPETITEGADSDG